MIQRSFSEDSLTKAMEPFVGYMIDDSFSYSDWISDDNNIALQDGESFGLFEFEYPGVYSGHYAFTVRGKEALYLAREMLNEIFTKHGAKTIKGMVLCSKRGAVWLSRQLGFKSYGLHELNGEKFELFCLTLDEFYHHNNKELIHHG